MLNGKFYLTIIAIFLIKEATGRKKFKTLLFESITTRFNPVYVRNYSLVINKDRLSLNMLMEFVRDLPVDVWLRLVITHKQQARASQSRVIFAYDVNICSIMSREANSVNLINLWMNNLMKFSNMPKECPWKMHTYSFTNFRPEKDTIPGFILNGIYGINTHFYLHDKNNALLTNTSIWINCSMK